MAALHPPDRDLTQRFLARRDEDAFRQLYRRHTPRMYALALRLLAGSAAEAEDAIQDAWLRAAEALERFEWRSSLPTWLCGIAINCARERLRSPHLRLVTTDRAVEAQIESRPSASARSAAAAPRRSEADRIDLERAIAALPDGYREVLVLHDVEGMTHGEIGVMLGVAPGTSKSQLHHARRALRAALGGTRSEANHAR